MTIIRFRHTDEGRAVKESFQRATAKVRIAKQNQRTMVRLTNPNGTRVAFETANIVEVSEA